MIKTAFDKGFFIILFLYLASFGICFNSQAQHPDHIIALKLATLDARDQMGADILYAQPAKPSDALIRDFTWNLEGLKSRCQQSEEEIADIIVSAWKLLKSRGYKFSLLDVTRQLTQNANNRSRFGNDKIDFKAVSGHWTKQFKSK